MQALPDFVHTQRKCGYAARCVALVGSHLSGGCASPRESLSALAVGETTQRNTGGCIKWKEAKAAIAKQAPEYGRKNTATGHPAASKAQQAGPSAKQMDLGMGWNHVVRGGVSSRLPPIHPKSLFPSSLKWRHQEDGEE